MFFISNIFIGAILGFIPLLPLLILFHFIVLKKDKKNSKKIKVPHIIGSYIFCFFLLCIFSVTGIPDIYSFKLYININLIPFIDILINYTQYILNIILFIPLGFLLPILWKKFEKKSLTIICGLLLSLLIEILQIFCFRATDIDDLLMNTLGTLVGYFLFILIRRIFPKISIFQIECINYWQYEPYIYFVLTWLSMFFVQPIISSWLWSFII